MIQSDTRAAAISAGAGTGPLVTVLVITRNSEADIRECLCGLMQQSIADRMEIIVADQGSEQCEWAVVADLQKKNERLISLRVPASAGRAAVDLATRMASGKYLAIVQPTDRMKQDACERLAAALEQRPDAALAYADSAPGAAGSDVDALWRREITESAGGFGDARDFIRRVSERFPVMNLDDAATQVMEESDPDKAFARIPSMIDGNNPRQAIGALELHLQRFPRHAIAHNNLAALWYQSGDKEKALHHYRMAVQLAPEDSTFQKNLADILYVETGEVDEAIAIYLELLKRSPKDIETLLNLGIICEGVGQPDEANSFYERALEIEPWNQVVRERLSDLRLRQAEAERQEPAVTESADDRYQRAQSLVERGDLDGAALELEAIVGTYPDFSPAHNDLAVLSYQKGAKDKALHHYEKAAALSPDNSIFQKNLADFYFVEGRNIDGAIAIYLEQLRREPKDVETLMSLGNICVMLERPEEAATFFDKVTQLEPWNQAARESLSNIRSCVNA